MITSRRGDHPMANTTTDLRDFFSATEARTDRWRQLSACGRAWTSAAETGKDAERVLAEAGRLLHEITALEAYWAYPGPRLMATVDEAFRDGHAAVFARLVQRISNALLTGGYRHDSAAWDPLEEGEARSFDALLPPDAQSGNGHKPYFEVL